MGQKKVGALLLGKESSNSFAACGKSFLELADVLSARPLMTVVPAVSWKSYTEDERMGVPAGASLALAMVLPCYVHIRCHFRNDIKCIFLVVFFSDCKISEKGRNVFA